MKTNNEWENWKRKSKNSDKESAERFLALAKSASSLKIKLIAMRAYHRAEQASR